jgi:hypothetical protein
MNIIEFFQFIKVPVTILHVIAVVFGMGSALVSDILFSFFAKDKKLNPTEISTLTILKKIVFYSLILIFISGIAIFLSNIEKYTHSTKFMAKMTILFVLLINGYVLNKAVWPHLLGKKFFIIKKERNMRRIAFVCGAVSVISWLAVCALGVLDKLSFSYFFIVSIYLTIILIGIVTSLIVEKRELN